MREKRRFLTVVLLVVFLFVAVGIGLLVYVRLAKVQLPDGRVDLGGGRTHVVRGVEPRPGDPIRKIIFDGNDVQYRLTGYLDSSAVVNEAGLIAADFMFVGDPTKRRIPVRIGKVDGLVLWGRYSQSFSGEVVWANARTSDIAPQISDQMVVLQLNILLDNSRRDFDYLRSVEESLDGLILAFRSGRYDAPPLDLSRIAIPAVGWVGAE